MANQKEIRVKIASTKKTMKITSAMKLVSAAKLSRAQAQIQGFRPYAEESTYALVAPRLKKILCESYKHDVFLNIDAEHYHFRDTVLKIYSKVLLETTDLNDFKDKWNSKLLLWN